MSEKTYMYEFYPTTSRHPLHNLHIQNSIKIINCHKSEEIAKVLQPNEYVILDPDTDEMLCERITAPQSAHCEEPEGQVLQYLEQMYSTERPQLIKDFLSICVNVGLDISGMVQREEIQNFTIEDITNMVNRKLVYALEDYGLTSDFIDMGYNLNPKVPKRRTGVYEIIGKGKTLGDQLTHPLHKN